MNENGNPVDWYAWYKIPKLDHATDPNMKAGMSFLYMDNSTNGQWLSSVSDNLNVNSSNQAMAYTLQQVYNNLNQTKVFYMMYNDEWPDGSTTTAHGHCKGVVGFDSTNGFWLIHSVPKFPPPNVYGYPGSGTDYGQSALCITLPYTSLNDIGNQLFFYNPWIYGSQISPEMSQENPMVQQVLNGKSQSVEPYNNQFLFRTSAGHSFINFAKHKKWGKELYYDFVAPSLGENLDTETWQNGGGDLSSNCSGSYHVFNINYINITSTINFSNSKDHSKWAVSPNGGQYVCIGDINRQEAQVNRGGGTMCFQNYLVWQTYNNSVQSVEPCP